MNRFVTNIQKSSAVISLMLNLILILLIVKKSPAELGSYRYLMIYTALFEMLYSVLDVLISPIIFSHESMLLVIVSTKNSLFSKNTLLILICVWCGFFGAFMLLFCIQFIYRYFVIIGSRSIKSFHDYRIVFWIMIPILSGTAWGAVGYFFMSPKVQINDILPDLLLNELDFIYEDITYIGPRCYYKTATGEEVVDIDSLISTAYCLTVMVTSVSCILYFATKTFLKIRKTLKTSTMESNKFNRIQSQTFYALVTQALIPVILLHFPCSYVMASAILNIDLGQSSAILSITVAMFPALDPLPVMLIIQNYRGTLFNVISTPVNIFVRRKITEESFT